MTVSNTIATFGRKSITLREQVWGWKILELKKQRANIAKDIIETDAYSTLLVQRDGMALQNLHVSSVGGKFKLHWN